MSNQFEDVTSAGSSRVQLFLGWNIFFRLTCLKTIQLFSKAAFTTTPQTKSRSGFLATYFQAAKKVVFTKNRAVVLQNLFHALFREKYGKVKKMPFGQRNNATTSICFWPLLTKIVTNIVDVVHKVFAIFVFF